MAGDHDGVDTAAKDIDGIGKAVGREERREWLEITDGPGVFFRFVRLFISMH